MRDDLTSAFLAELDKNNRYPITLCEFHFEDGIRYLSDQIIGTNEGLAQDYEPIVEDWGNLKDNVRIEPILGASSLEVRQCSLSIINIGDPPFSQKFKDVNPENVKVYLYQWFSGLALEDMALIDIFVCQDPIAVSEAQSLLKIQLVSPIMAQNPYIWGPNKFLDVRYPMVLGKWKTVAKSMNTGPTAYLLYDFDQTFTGEVFLDNNQGDWPTGTFNVYIDSEQISVSNMAVSKMTIVGRGRNGTIARPHIRGALVCDPNAQYDYSLTAGPVGSIANIQGDGETYNNPVTVLPGQDPAIIRFDGRPPWHKVEAGDPGEPIIPDPETTNQYGLNSEVWSSVVGVPSNPGNINNSGSNAVMSFDDTIGEQASNTFEFTTTTWDDPPDAPNENAVIEVTNPDGANTPSTGDQARLFHDSDISAQMLLEDFEWYFGVDGFPDLSYLGTFVSVEFEAYIQSEGTSGLFNNSGNTLHFYVNGAPGGGDDETRLWGVKSKAYDTGVYSGINSWSQLRSASVGLFFELTSIDETIGRTKFDVEIWYIRARVTYIGNDDPTYPKQEVVSHFNRDLSSLGAFVSAEVQIRFDCSSINCTLDQDVVFRTNNNQANNQTLWGRTISSTQGMATVTVYPSIGSMATLKTARLGMRHSLVSPVGGGVRRYATTNIAYVLWKITYQPGAIDQPDEERVVYVYELTADVTALSGANMTPATAIKNLLTNVGDMGEYVDEANFDEYHTIYDGAQYYFNGLIDGETRLHDALKSLIRQGSTRLAWNAGKVKLVSSFVQSLAPVVNTVEQVEEYRNKTFAEVMDIDPSVIIYKVDQRQRSATEKRMRFDDVRNKVTIRYKPDYKLEEWLGDVEYRDDDSINQIGEQEESYDYPYVSNDNIIADIGARLLELKGSPRSFDTFRCYFKGFVIEKSDQVFFETDFNDYYGVVGPVLTANRIFGSGKSERFNLFEITILATPVVVHEANVLDVVNVNSEFIDEVLLTLNIVVEDDIELSDAFSTEKILNHFLTVNEQVLVNETLTSQKGVARALQINEVVNLSDTVTDWVGPAEFLAISDVVRIEDELSNFSAVLWRINVEDVIEVIDHNNVWEIIAGGYGVGGYGEGGYGGALNYYMVYFGSDYVTFGGDDVIHYK